MGSGDFAPGGLPFLIALSSTGRGGVMLTCILAECGRELHWLRPRCPLELPGNSGTVSTWRLSFRIQVVTSREQQQNMHSRSHSRTSSLPLSGSEAPEKWIPRRVIRVLRSPRRIATWVVGSLVIVLLVRIVHQRPAAVGTTVCEFVSPVEAYNTALRRLRSTDNNTLRAHLHHHYSPTGHLVLNNNPDAPHPIPLLLALGEKRWEELLARQSRTLGEAVREYERRYGRRPPKGFDVWWDFVATHEMVLPDEYDRINLDLAPFWALPKSEMRKRLTSVHLMKETFTLAVEDGRVDIEMRDKSGLEWGGTWSRALDAASLVKTFARFLPDLRATFSIFDQPQIYLSWARRSSLVELGLRGEHTRHLTESDTADVRWSRSCAPDSNLRRNSHQKEGKSFIYDSVEASDLCQNPYLMSLHGLTLDTHGHDSHPRPHTQLLPLFSLARTSLNSDILITPLDQFADPAGPDPEWSDKTESKLVWRGSSTGMAEMTRDTPWRDAHRIRLHRFAANDSEELNSVLAADLESSGPLGIRSENMTTAKLTDFYFDMKLAGGPIQCSNDDGTCDDIRAEIEFAPHQSASELNKHKFLFDIDGNGWSGRFRRLMSTNSMVIKAGIFTEWFQPHLIPWFMYVPAKLDFTDLADIMAFFRGTPQYPDGGFDEVAEALARNGQCFVKRMFRIQDLEAYMMRLFLEYARLAAPDGSDMDFYYNYEEEEGEDVKVDEGSSGHGDHGKDGEKDDGAKSGDPAPI